VGPRRGSPPWSPRRPARARPPAAWGRGSSPARASPSWPCR
jgi:hypothetical protein